MRRLKQPLQEKNILSHMCMALPEECYGLSYIL